MASKSINTSVDLKAVATFTILEDETGRLCVKDRDGRLTDVEELEFWSKEFRARPIPLGAVDDHETRLLAKHRRVFSRPIGPGYVYLIGINNQIFKIGQTGHLKSRVLGLRRQIRRERNLDIELLHVIEVQDRQRAETMLHKVYAEKRVEREWFNLDPTDIEDIKAIASI